MLEASILKLLCNGPVIPAARSHQDFTAALAGPAPAVIMLFGNIITLPDYLEKAKQVNKRLIVHLDLFEGIGKDKIGVKYLSRLGVTALITVKSHLAKAAREEGMIVIQRLFLMDSDSLRTGIQQLKAFKPDALEILPASVPASVISQLIRETGLPIFAGGLVSKAEEVEEALHKGVVAVSTSRRELWTLECKNR